MMVEFFGVLSILLSALLFSMGLIRDYRSGLREMEALYDMVSYIRDNIEHLMKPLPDIFQAYTNDVLENCGFLPCVRQTDLRQAWQEKPVMLRGEAYTLLTDFIHEVGRGYRTEELRLCEYTLERLGGLLEQMRAEAANKIKLYKTVPIMFALSVILILI